MHSVLPLQSPQNAKTEQRICDQRATALVAATFIKRKPFEFWRIVGPPVENNPVSDECSEHGKKFGVVVAVQNHGDFINSGEQHLSLLQCVDHEWCAALVDTGEYLAADPYADIALMVPYAVSWQIKETTRSQADSPRTDMKRLLTIIRRSWYRGYLPIETLAMKRKDYDSFVEVPKMLAELRGAIAATAAIDPQSESK